MSKTKKIKDGFRKTIAIIIVLLLIMVGAVYYRSTVEVKHKKPWVPYLDLMISMAPFLNPSNETTNKGGWDGMVHALDGCWEGPECAKDPDPAPFNETAFSRPQYNHSGNLKSVGEVPEVFWEFPKYIIYVFAIEGKGPRFADSGKAKILDNTTVKDLETYELHTIENAKFVYLDNNKNGLLDIGDSLIIFRDLDSDRKADMKSRDGFSLGYKGNIIGTGHLNPYINEYDSNSYATYFKITPFSNKSSVDGRLTRGWSIKLPSLNPGQYQGSPLGETPLLRDVHLWVYGVTYNETTFAGPFPVTDQNASDTCFEGTQDVYVFVYPKFNQMVFDDKGVINTVTPSTVCSLSDKNLRSLTGAVFVYIDADQSSTFTGNDMVYVYEPMDENSHEVANWVQMGFSSQAGIVLNLEDW